METIGRIRYIADIICNESLNWHRSVVGVVHILGSNENDRNCKLNKVEGQNI